MTKTKTSKKQEATSIEDMPIVRLKKGVKTTKYEPRNKLKDSGLTINKFNPTSKS